MLVASSWSQELGVARSSRHLEMDYGKSWHTPRVRDWTASSNYSFGQAPRAKKVQVRRLNSYQLLQESASDAGVLGSNITAVTLLRSLLVSNNRSRIRWTAPQVIRSSAGLFARHHPGTDDGQQPPFKVLAVRMLRT
ncbi:hypothetical protein MMC07_005361 [Pseudocyphellaria aurata]|nr:hypothetical protein [Pseudocyphellaria aurata]